MRRLGLLLQKFYVHDPASGDIGGVYFVESKESLDGFRGSDLARSIQHAYQVKEPPLMRALEVVQILREAEARPAATRPG